KEQPGRTTTSHRSNRHPPAQYNSDSPQAPSVKIPHRDWVVQKKLQISQAYSAWGIEQIHPGCNAAGGTSCSNYCKGANSVPVQGQAFSIGTESKGFSRPKTKNSTL